jgi:hypothetical protein
MREKDEKKSKRCKMETELQKLSCTWNGMLDDILEFNPSNQGTDYEYELCFPPPGNEKKEKKKLGRSGRTKKESTLRHYFTRNRSGITTILW